SGGSGTLQGTLTATASSGVVTFSGLNHQLATTITIAFSSGALTSATSGNVVVSQTASTHVSTPAQRPATTPPSADFTPQPVITIEDQYSNLLISYFPTRRSSDLSGGSGTLQGTLTATASSGVVTFSGLNHQLATTITIAFSSGALTSATSGNVVVSPAAESGRASRRQRSDTATAGVAFTQQPVIRVEDQYGNLRGSDNSTVVTAARSGGTGTLQGTLTATASSGVATFSGLNHQVATTITIAFTSGSLTSATSGNVVVSAASANKLTIQTQPSSTATAGVAFSQQPVIRIEDQYGNLISSDNTTDVTSARSRGTGTLQGTLTATASSGVSTFTGLTHQVTLSLPVALPICSLTSATSGNVVVSAASANKLTIQTQPSSTATAGVAFSQQPVVRVEDQYGNL